MNLKKPVFLLFFLLIVKIAGFSQSDKTFEVLKNLEIFSTTYKMLHLNYVDETQPGKLMKTAIDAMLQSLDPYTNYIPEANIEDFKMVLTKASEPSSCRVMERRISRKFTKDIPHKKQAFWWAIASFRLMALRLLIAQMTK